VSADGASSAASAPLRGRSGPYDGADLLRGLLEAGVSGTLALGDEGGLCLTLIEAGESVARSNHGDAPPSDRLDVAFAFHPHALPDDAMHGVPELPALLPEATLPGLACVPDLPGGRELPPGLSTLPSLMAHLDAQGTRGALAAGGADGTVAALVVDGKIVAAVGDKGGREVRRGDALRLLARHAGDPASAPIRLVPLPDPLLTSVAGVMLDRKRDAPHGAHVGERAAVLLEHGVPALRVAYRAAERLGRFAAAEDVARLPALPLPEDPPDWETRTYTLTLRGRDALDPMTELAMRFDEEYGPSGKEILRALRRGLDVETTGAELGLELDQLAAWLRRLEGDGMIRSGG
jgi:hypothetical protein